MFETNNSTMAAGLVSYLFESHNQEVNYIRAEMHEAQQRIDRDQIEQEEAEENEKAYRETMQRLGMVHDPSPIETDEYRQFIGAGCRRLAAAGGAR
jgi:DNA-binding LacI/PurR family transcriptional regulator